MQRNGRRFVQYGYLGLVIGYVVYYGLYAGNFQYYFSGAWTHEENQLSTLLKPGFYLFNRPIPIPKLVAVPLTLAFFVAASYLICSQLEKAYRSYLKRHHSKLSHDQILHRVFSICTFVAFNTFFIYGGRPEILRLPLPLQLVFNGLVVLVSTLWLYRTWGRSDEQYKRESLVEKLRRQLKKLPLNFSQILEGRSLDELKPDEVYILAKTLPGATQQDRLQVYRGILKEALTSGQTNTASSLEVFEQMRQQLGLNDDEHNTILTELGIEDPSLLNSRQQQTQENHLRLESYRQAISFLLLELVESGTPLEEALQLKSQQIQALKQAYRITATEDTQVLAALFQPNSDLRRKAEALLAQLQGLASRYQAMDYFVPNPQAPVLVLLRSTIASKQQRFTAQLLSILEILGEDPEAIQLGKRTGILAENVLPVLLEDRTAKWSLRLSPQIVQFLTPHRSLMPVGATQQATLTATQIGGISGRSDRAIDVLEDLLQESNPLTQAASLYALHQLHPPKAQEAANRLLSDPTLDELLRETAEGILHPPSDPTTLEKLLWLFETDCLKSLNPEALISIARAAGLRSYSDREAICGFDHPGIPSSEILILIQGKAQIQVTQNNLVHRLGTVLPGQPIGQLGGLPQPQEGAEVVSIASRTQALAIAAQDFETLLHQHPQLAKHLLVGQGR